MSEVPQRISSQSDVDTIVPEKVRLPSPLAKYSKQSVIQRRSLGLSTAKQHWIATRTLLLIAVFTVYHRIWYPNQVVFDEVHFGKFASYYLRRTYYFDVHPPLAKMMYAATGYFLGYDGRFDFGSIGEQYALKNVPYIGLRLLPATLSIVSVSLMYKIMKESGYAVLACIIPAAMLLLDNAIVAQSRLILLDGVLIFFMLNTIYAYIQFRKARHREFTAAWWKWLFVTGAAMSMTLSVKMVGLFTVASIAIPVLIDLWDLFDVRRGLTLTRFGKHFFARFLGLFVVPCMIYLFWFYIHFAILNQSGPGDAYMSTRFQETLTDNSITLQSLEIHFYDTITLAHKDTDVYLHSHQLHYPLRYEDGRISSQGQQVCGIHEPDNNSHWRVLPTRELLDGQNTSVQHGDMIQLEHIVTGTLLLTHNVASPLLATNQEMTTVSKDSPRYNETLFKVLLDDASHGKIWRTHKNSVRLIHANTNVAIWSHSKVLPEWALHLQDVNGNKKNSEKSSRWIAKDIIGKNATEINMKTRKVVKHMPFLQKFVELQLLMLKYNSQLTASHPYQSTPLYWPALIRGISYWTNADTKEQIYMLGNVVGWYLALASILLYGFILSVDKLVERRGTRWIGEPGRQRLIRSGGFFVMLWAFHYFPFFIMGRSLFLHHYLPALACSYLALGAVFQFLFIDGMGGSPVTHNHEQCKPTKVLVTKRAIVAATIMIIAQFTVFIFLAPVTYGTPGLNPQQVERIQVYDSWDLQFGSRK